MMYYILRYYSIGHEEQATAMHYCTLTEVNEHFQAMKAQRESDYALVFSVDDIYKGATLTYCGRVQ